MTPYTTADRTVIPCYCWVRQPGTETRCTRMPHDTGRHTNDYTRESWANRGREPQ